MEMHGRTLSTVATDALVPMHQTISIYNADWIFIVVDLIVLIRAELSRLFEIILKNKILFWKNT